MQVLNIYGVKFSMSSSIYMVFNMHFPNRLATLRKQHNLTQQELGNRIGLTKAQVYRYEKGTSQPTLDVIKNLAIELRVSADFLVFGEEGRKPDESLMMLLESISQLDPDEKHVIKEMVEGILLKHQARVYGSNATSN